MTSILSSLGFKTLHRFLQDLNLQSPPEDALEIYIKHSKHVLMNKTPFVSALNLLEEAQRWLLVNQPQNYLCAGISKEQYKCNGDNRVVCNWPNSTLNVFKSHVWRTLFEYMGLEISFFILTRCTIVQNICGKNLFLAGDFFSLRSTPFKFLRPCFVCTGQDKNGGICRSSQNGDIRNNACDNEVNHLVLNGCMPGESKSSDKNQCHSQKNARKPCHSDLKQYLNLSNNLVNKEFDFCCGMRNTTSNTVNKIVLFHKISRYKGVDSVAFYIKTVKDVKPEKHLALKLRVKSILKLTQLQAERTAVTAIYKSFFREELDFFNGEICDRSKRAAKPFSATAYGICSIKIASFLFSVTKKICKHVIDKYNLGILRKKIFLLVSRNKFETLSYSELVRYFRISTFKFFKSKKCNRNEFVIRSNLVKNFLLALFEDLIVPLISSYFYVTETAFSKYKVFYFMRCTWNYFQGIYINEFLENFQEKEAQNRNSPSKRDKLLAKFSIKKYPSLRCIPKKSGMRVVTNLSKSNINRNLSSAFSVLKHENGQKLKNSILGHNETFNKLFSYFKRSKSRNYVIKLDLRRCFDRIPHNELTALISTRFEKSRYRIQNFWIFENICGEAKTRKFTTLFKSMSITKVIASMELKKNKIIKADLDDIPITRMNLLSKVLDVINRNTVKFKNKLYVQTKGIPQGSTISPFLCSLYLAHLDDLYFDKKIRKGIILRYIDDFLIITEDINEICSFLREVVELRHLGIEFNFDKVDSNFGFEETMVSFNKNFTWPCKMAQSTSRNQQSEVLEKNRAKVNSTCESSVKVCKTRNDLEQEKKSCTGNSLAYKNSIYDTTKIAYKSTPSLSHFFDSVSNRKPSDTPITWCGIKVYPNELGIKYAYRDKYFKYSVVHRSLNPGKSMFYSLRKILVMRSVELLIHKDNVKSYENVYDIGFFCFRKVKILMGRLDFVNIMFIKRILNYIKDYLYVISKSRGVYLTRHKLNDILNSSMVDSGLKQLLDTEADKV